MTPRALLVATLVLTALPVSCNSPTLPLPPPSDQVEVTRDGEYAVISGPKHAVQPFAIVAAFNHRTNSGVVGTANADGVFVLQIPAVPGDTIEIWQRVGNSPPAIAVTVPQR